MVLMEAPVIMVGIDPVEVERQLAAGELACLCGGGLTRWGYARPRIVRGLGQLHPRRVRCLDCRVTHVLLSVACLLRRADAVEEIGAALRTKAAGSGHRVIAARLGRSASTVRGWLRRFGRNAETTRLIMAGLLVELDPLHGPLLPTATPFADAVEVVGVVAAAARRRLGVVGAVSPWQLVAAATNGRLLAPGGPVGVANTN